LGVLITPEGERDARSLLATMDHADIRGLGTAFHLSVAGLPRSKVGDHSAGCPHNVLEGSPHRVHASRSYSSVLRFVRCRVPFFVSDSKIDRL
jgi:hypothetical protein